MTYPASPSDAGTNRVRPDAAQFWAGAAATAVVAALIALVGILICRWTLNIPILAPAGDGAWGNAHTAEYALVAALIALIAGGLLYLLVLATPQPGMFFNWIMGLATLAAVVYPFSTSAPLDQKAATAIVNLVLGIAIMSLLTAVAARAIRRPVARTAYRETTYREGTGYGPEYGQQQDYAEPGYGAGDGYVPEPPRNQPVRPGDEQPTRPMYAPRNRDTRP
jgi:uncharacterized protein DUF6069